VLFTACDLGSGARPSPDDRAGAPPARPTLFVSPPSTAAPLASAAATLRAPTALPAASNALPVATDAPEAPATAPSQASAPANLLVPKLFAKVEDGGCGLASIDAKYLYARAPSCRDVLRIDRTTGALESKKLGTPLLVEAVVDGVAYGCPLGESKACALTRVPLDGGAAKKVASLPGFIDGPSTAQGGLIAARFIQLDASGAPDFQSERATLETVDLESGARTVVFGPVGVGSVSLGPKGLLFEGALTPKENVGAPSWGLWLIAGSTPPKRLPVTDVRSMSADEQHVYYTSSARELRRIALDGSRDEQLTAAIAEPPSEPNKLRVTPAVRAASDAVYVSTASVSACWIWRIPKP
jgi:hypothetical protein